MGILDKSIFENAQEAPFSIQTEHSLVHIRIASIYGGYVHGIINKDAISLIGVYSGGTFTKLTENDSNGSEEIVKCTYVDIVFWCKKTRIKDTRTFFGTLSIDREAVCKELIVALME